MFSCYLELTDCCSLSSEHYFSNIQDKNKLYTNNTSYW